MAETLYAMFSDPTHAKAAQDELLKLGFLKEETSLILKDQFVDCKTDEGDYIEDTRPTTPMSGTEFRHGFDPLGNDLRQLSIPRIEPVKDLQFDLSDRFAEVCNDGGAVLGVTLRDPALQPQVEAIFSKNDAKSIETHKAFLS